jgi:hemerythrin
MSEKTIVDWDDRYLIGIPLIDEQHKELIRLTNTLYESCLQGDEAARKKFKRTIQGTVDYVRFHFSAEEQILKNVNYPELASHKKQHEKFVKQVLEEAKNFVEGKKFVPNTFVRFLRDWILTHIAMEDRKYADYIINLKKNGGLKKISA